MDAKQALEAQLAASAPDAAGRLVVIRQWVQKLSDDTIDAMGGQAVVEAYVLSLYDQYVVPLDLPGVPAIGEPAVDALLKRLISALIWAVDDET